jgi:hypothetical protein
MAAVGDILRATLVMAQLDAQIANLVYTFRVISGSEADYDVIAAAISAWHAVAETGVMDSFLNDIASIEFNVAERNLATNQWDGKATVAHTSYTGTHAGEGIPAGNAVVLRYITQAARRQGRKFLPGIPEALVNGNTLNSVLLADVILFALDTVLDITAGGATLRPCTYNVDPLSALFESASEMTGVTVLNTFSGYQRRRQPGDGI